jgi:hypothetical protein
VVNGGDGAAALVFRDQGAAAAEDYLVTASQLVGNLLERGGQAFEYTNVGRMTLHAGDHGNHIDVRAVGVATTIDAGNGVNTINVGDALNGNRLLVPHPLTVHGQQGTNQLTLDDQGTGAAVDYTLTAHTFTRTGLAVISYDGVRSLVLRGGGGNDTYHLQSTAAGSHDAVVAGAGNDTFTVTVTPADGPSLSLDGGAGANVLDVTDVTGLGLVRNHPALAPPGSGTVTVNYPNQGPTVTIDYRHFGTVDAVSDLVGRAHASLVQLVRKPNTSLFLGLLQIVNQSATPIQGPIRIVLQGLTPFVTLLQARFNGQTLAVGHTASGDPYFTVPVGALKPGQKVVVALEFLDPLLLPIQFFAHPYGVG